MARVVPGWAKPGPVLLGFARFCSVCSSAETRWAFVRPTSSMKRSHHASCQAGPSEATAAGAAFTEAVQESGVSLSHDVIARLRSSLLPRIARATPRLLTSTRSFCPTCSWALYQSDLGHKRSPRANCWIYGEPAAFQLVHVPRWCKHCVTLHMARWPGDPAHGGATIRYWCVGTGRSPSQMIHVHSGRSWRQTSGMQTSGSDTSHSV